MKGEEFVSKTVAEMPFSGIRKFFDIVAAMPSAISLGVGEPDFKTPWRVREAAIFHLEKGQTSYSANAGTIEFRRAVSKYMGARFGLDYDPASEILATVGASEGIDLAFRAMLEQGDEVVIPEPCFVAYKPCVRFAGGVPVPVRTTMEDDFRLTPEALEAAITPKTKAVLISYPNNPTGAVLEEADVAALAAVLRRYNICVISDEIYAELTYTGKNHVSIASMPGMKDRTIVINGFSKAYAMTGWRLGFLCAPPGLLSAMLKIHQYELMCAPTTAQYAAIEALEKCGDSVIEMREEYDRRRRVVLAGFKGAGIPCFEPLGAFYAFPYIGGFGLSSEEFCNRLLTEQKVAAVPGTAFSEMGEGFIRVSYATSMEKLKTALERIGEFAEGLRR